jgi:cell division protein FtsL
MWQKIVFTAIIFLALFARFGSGIIYVSASNVTVNEEIEHAREKLGEAYNATSFAEQAGANVEEAVQNLNRALEYINQAENLTIQGNMEQAYALTQSSTQLCEETLIMAEELKTHSGLLNFYTKRILPVVFAVILVGICTYAFLFGRRVWKKRQENKFMEMKVKISKKTMNPRKVVNLSQNTNEEKMIIVAVLSAIIIIAGLLVYVSITPAPKENFVVISYLNSEKKAANYPELLILASNNTFTLWVGVENFMNRVEFVNVQTKITNTSIPTEKTPQEAMLVFEKVLINGEKWEFPVTMTINKTGAYRITFELWLYDEMQAIFNNANFCDLQLEVVSET